MFDLQLNFGSEVTSVAVRLNILGEVPSLLRELIPAHASPRVVVVTDDRVGAIYEARLCDSFHQAGFETLPSRMAPGEASKSLASAEALYHFLSDHRVGRDAVILALGGGVVSDLAGFVAATWMRGVRFAICPTTMEADVDASIGGKTAINVPGGKNLVGAFHQPMLVAVDPACLKTLEGRDVRAGLAESIKHALLFSERFLSFHEAHADRLLSLDPDRTTELILKNLRLKAKIVGADPHESSGRRMLLNFGHTIGHAVEACCGFQLRHGECVALGLLAACRLSQAFGLLEASALRRVEALLHRFGLPTLLRQPVETRAILETLQNDKKVRGGVAPFVLLERIGRPVVRDDVPERLVRAAYESLLP